MTAAAVHRAPIIADPARTRKSVRWSDDSGEWSAFERTYLTTDNPVAPIGHPVITTESDMGDASIEANVKLSNGQRWLKGQGNGPIAAFVDALRGSGIAVEITDVRLPGVHAPGEGARR